MRKLKPGAGNALIRTAQKISDRAKTQFQGSLERFSPVLPSVKLQPLRRPGSALTRPYLTLMRQFTPPWHRGCPPQYRQGEELMQRVRGDHQARGGLPVAMATRAW